MTDEAVELDGLRQRLSEEEKAYGDALARLDQLASFALPLENRPEMPSLLAQLNERWQAPAAPETGGLRGGFKRGVWRVVEPVATRQTEFNSALVQLLNAQAEETARLFAHLRTLASTVVQFAQRVEPSVDVRDRMATGLATTRAELILESFDRRLESLGRRLEGLLA